MMNKIASNLYEEIAIERQGFLMNIRDDSSLLFYTFITEHSPHKKFI